MRSLLLTALLFLQPSIGSAEELGRLFLSPSERARLETLRRTEAEAAQLASGLPEAAAEPVAEAAASPPPAAVSFDGIVTRSDGTRTIWVNGESSYDGRFPELPLTLRSGAPARVIVQPEGADAVVLKPGQRWDPPGGEGNAAALPAAGNR
ncbi:MAG: hypothetical protein HKO62_10665 [Gammaproteobacteria bacterium]|nr:hypothetical protein [Gammaproteobacteria bacterium]NNM01202.1 hypothetical protein [Gammaproteobacteria bacterium]